jgi:hypothetical protein
VCVTLQNQVQEGILENVAVVRNPVGELLLCEGFVGGVGGLRRAWVSQAATAPPLQGNTHEDIDALFGVLRRFLKTRTWKTIDELKALIAECLLLWVRPTAISLRAPPPSGTCSPHACASHDACVCANAERRVH